MVAQKEGAEKGRLSKLRIQLEKEHGKSAITAQSDAEKTVAEKMKTEFAEQLAAAECASQQRLSAVKEEHQLALTGEMSQVTQLHQSRTQELENKITQL